MPSASRLGVGPVSAIDRDALARILGCGMHTDPDHLAVVIACGASGLYVWSLSVYVSAYWRLAAAAPPGASWRALIAPADIPQLRRAVMASERLLDLEELRALCPAQTDPVLLKRYAAWIVDIFTLRGYQPLADPSPALWGVPPSRLTHVGRCLAACAASVRAGYGDMAAMDLWVRGESVVWRWRTPTCTVVHGVGVDAALAAAKGAA